MLMTVHMGRNKAGSKELLNLGFPFVTHIAHADSASRIGFDKGPMVRVKAARLGVDEGRNLCRRKDRHSINNRQMNSDTELGQLLCRLYRVSKGISHDHKGCRADEPILAAFPNGSVDEFVTAKIVGVHNDSYLVHSSKFLFSMADPCPL